MDVDRFQYLILMGLCLVVTLPLEFVFGARVWRRPPCLVAGDTQPIAYDAGCASSVTVFATRSARARLKQPTGGLADPI